MIAFTDGSSRGNPGRGGWGSVIFYDDNVIELGGFEELTTNNQMELTAVIESLCFAQNKSTELTIVTDSKYVLKGATEWLQKWKEHSWKTSQKKDVLNKTLWMKLDGLLAQISTNFLLVKGHSGMVLNERADQIATSFADSVSIDCYDGLCSYYNIATQEDVNIIIKNLSTNTHNISSSEKSARQHKKKGPGYSYISSVNNIIIIHPSWVECEKRVKGVKGARYKKAMSQDEENQIVAEFKNTPP